jgi:hypothetical protein
MLVDVNARAQPEVTGAAFRALATLFKYLAKQLVGARGRSAACNLDAAARTIYVSLAQVT